MPRRPTGDLVVYAARMRDGTYRTVEAVSWADVRRHLGRAVLSIRRRFISFDQLFKCAYDEDARRRLYETADQEG